jgi:hypothetical protein
MHFPSCHEFYILLDLIAPVISDEEFKFFLSARFNKEGTGFS